MSYNQRLLVLFSFLAVAVSSYAASLTASITQSPSLPSSVGTPVHFTASASGAPAASLRYRFRVRRLGEDYKLIRDFSLSTDLNWTAPDYDGFYQMEVTAKNIGTGETALTSTTFQQQSLVLSGQPAITPTAHPLVVEYSAPACGRGQRMRVIFTGPDGAAQSTPYKNCRSSASLNFYLAGIRPNSSYTAHHVVDTGSQFLPGPDLSFVSGDVPADLYKDTVQISRPTSTGHILLGSPLLGLAPVAYDLDGTVLWYAPKGLSSVTRAEDGGQFWAFIQNNSGPAQQVIRKFDLAGNTILETNAERINEQLAALGKRPITTFHHEVRTLPDGRILALASVEQILNNVQGPGPVNVIGDMIVVLDPSLNVIWTWDAFDNLDLNRAAILGETCASGPGCPPLRLGTNANDWTHGNSVQQTADGNLLYSSRHQDWLIKISFDSANGDGHVIWRLGKDGDFQFVSNDSYPWFSHQHDANFALLDPTLLLVFDNGNTRVAQQGGGNSRGQAFQIDEINRTITPVLNVDLGVFSLALGSAQFLSDGSFHFDAGYVAEGANPADSFAFQIDNTGNVLYKANTAALLYRSFRMLDMYTPE